MIYLDNAATTKMDGRVLKAMLPYMEDSFGNADTPYSMGRKAKEAVEEARYKLALSIGASPEEVFFTSGGTESNNWVISSFSQGNIGCSTTEHASVLVPATELSAFLLPVGWNGRIDMDGFHHLIYGNPSRESLASVALVNNETGTIQDIASLCAWCHSCGWKFHTDATQALGKIHIDVKSLGVDFMTFSSHKVHGPKGVGALYVSRDIKPEPLMKGGHQEGNRRAGTTNVPGVVGFGEAAMIAEQELPNMGRCRRQTENFYTEVRKAVPFAIINGDTKNRVATILNIYVGVECAALVGEMDKQEIQIACGAACSTGKVEPSHVLTAMGLSAKEALGCVRISASRFTTDKDIETAARTMGLVVNALEQKGDIGR